jgi:hypothetical protein
VALLDELVRDVGADAGRAALADWLRENPGEIVTVLARLAGVDYDPDTGDPRFAATEFVVEADDFSRRALWAENETLDTGRSLHWEDDPAGLAIVLGEVAGLPVNVSFVWARLDGHLVLFYSAVSLVTHRGIVERWLLRHCHPKWDGGTRSAHCDALNFHLCREYCGGS